MTETTFYAEDYTNSLGQTVKPGDDVVIVTSAYKSTRIRKGKFLGVRKDSTGRFRGATCEYVAKRYNWRTQEHTDEVCKTTAKLGRVYALNTNAWGLSV